jgi:hypothetical protein
MTDRRRLAAWRVFGPVSGILASAIATAAPPYDPGSVWSLVTHSDNVGGLYVSLDLGAATYPHGIAVAVPGIALQSADSHTVTTAGAIDFGWRFSPNFSAEAGFADLGRTTSAFTSGANMSLSIRGPTAAFIGSMGFDRWESYLKLGYLFSDAELTINGAPPLGSGASRDTFATFVAAGALYTFDDRWYMKLEFDHYQGVGYDVGDAAETTNINVGTVGVGLRF